MVVHGWYTAVTCKVMAVNGPRFHPFGSDRITAGHVSLEKFSLSSSIKLIRIIGNLLLQVLQGLRRIEIVRERSSY